MLTVAELAKDLNTSTTTIYRTLNKVQQSSTEQLTEKRKGTTHITPNGEKLIRENLSPVEQNDGNRSTSLNGVEHIEPPVNDEIMYLRKQNETLLQELSRERDQNRAEIEKEREHSRQQAERLAELSEKLAELTKNGQVLLLKQEQNALLLSENPNPKKSIWQRLFKSNKEV
jgi:transcriptional antiterminator